MPNQQCQSTEGTVKQCMINYPKKAKSHMTPDFLMVLCFCAFIYAPSSFQWQPVMLGVIIRIAKVHTCRAFCKPVIMGIISDWVGG